VGSYIYLHKPLEADSLIVPWIHEKTRLNYTNSAMTWHCGDTTGKKSLLACKNTEQFAGDKQ
jgi:hypothetical protein